jgi:hypothetical protein
MRSKRKRPNGNVDGAPEIARPDKRQGAFVRALLLDASRTARDELKALFNELLPYEKQLAFVYAWFFEMWQVLECDDGKAAKEAHVELQSLFGTYERQLLRLALSKQENKTKQWAGKMLANSFTSVLKHDKKLSETNKAYLAEKKKISGEKQLVQVLFPKPISEAVQRELRSGERYRKTLRLLKAAFRKQWKEAARRQNIPEGYWDFAELPDFSQESEPQWWKFLWPLIKKNSPDFLRELRDGKFPTRGIRYQARWASYRKEFRNVLRTLARLRDDGVL